MKLHFNLLFLLLFLSFISIQCIEIEADYDEYLDMISIDGQLFIAVEVDESSLRGGARNLHEGEELNVECECSEEHVKGMTLMFFIFMVICKCIISYSHVLF